MSGSGNDFIVVDNRKKIIKNPPRFAAKYCHRKFGIGADGLLCVESSHLKQTAFRMRYVNSDGSHASFCGNGARCIAIFAYMKKIAPKKMKFESDAGIIHAEIARCNVKIKIPAPKDIKLDFKLNVKSKKYNIAFVNAGVPHAVVFVKNIKNADVDKSGRVIRWHKRFQPAGANVNFVKVLGKNKLQIRTYERGVEGETLACGTGVVASSIISILKKYVSSPVSVLTQGGEVLKVHCKNVVRPSPAFAEDRFMGCFPDVFLEGKVNLVFEGKTKYN